VRSVIDVDRYLARLGFDATPSSDLDGLVALQRRHLTTVPFENLDLVVGGGVPHDRERALVKIVGDGTSRRGGWCFENNGAFGLLLEALGFDVMLLGAAVLLDGPSTAIEHLALEVAGGSGALTPRLVDVGFGQGPDVPIELNRSGPQRGGHADYELLASPQGTTLAELVDGVPAPRYRFKRVAHDFDDFAAAAATMASDPDRSWSSKPFATRLLDDGPDRVVLTHDRLKVRRSGDWSSDAVSEEEWSDALLRWFGIDVADIGLR
jgi:N-hydroxyarylamine O-acetyltransferase